MKSKVFSIYEDSDSNTSFEKRLERPPSSEEVTFIGLINEENEKCEHPV